MPVTVRFVGSGDSFGSGGRFQTCILVDGPRGRFAVDFGASSLIALAQQGIEHNSIDAILLTHLHGDHAAGVPFLLMDAMLAARRARPSPSRARGIFARAWTAIREALFPGSHAMTPKFPLHWIEMEPGRPHPVLDLARDPGARPPHRGDQSDRAPHPGGRQDDLLHRRHGMDRRRRPRRREIRIY